MAVITASPKSFSRLIELQEAANDKLATIKTLMETAQLTSIATLVETKRIDDDGDRLEKIEQDTLENNKESLKIQKAQLASLKEMQRISTQNAEAITNVAEQFTTISGPIDRIRDSFNSLSTSVRQNFSLSGISSRLMKATNIGGVFNKKIASDRFVKEQKELGSEKSEKQLRADFKIANEIAKNIKQNEEQIKSLEKLSGLSIEKLKNTPKGKELLEKRSSLAGEYGKVDIRSSLVSEQIDGIPSSTQSFAATPSAEAKSSAEEKEITNEAIKRQEEQSDLLQKIEENTRGESPDQKASQASGNNGLLSGIGLGLKSLGLGLKGLGVGAGKGIQALLMGIARGVMALANPAAILGLGAITVATLGLGKALQLAAPAIEAFAPVLMRLVDVIGTIFVKAIETIPAVLGGIRDIIVSIGESIVNIINAVTESIERLSQIDGSNLLSVGAGLAAVAAGLVAFSAGGAVAGVSNLVGGLFRKLTGQKSTTEQLEEISTLGPNLEKAGVGIEKLGSGLSTLSSIDTEKIKTISQLPLEKLAAVGASMQSPANVISSSSAENANLAINQGNSSKGNTNIVNAPVNNVSNSTQIIKAPVRNRESSISRYIDSTYVAP